MNVRDNLLYTKTHEWLLFQEDGQATLGITDYAQSELGDIIFVDVPDVGDTIESEESLGSIESVKAVSDMELPFSVTITEFNDALQDAPQSVNSSPYDDGWIMKIKVSEDVKNDLLTPDQYKELIGS